MLRQIKPEVECYLNMSFLHTPLDRDTWNHFLFQNKFLHFDRYPFGMDFSLLRKSWDEQQLTKMVIFSKKGTGSLSRFITLCVVLGTENDYFHLQSNRYIMALYITVTRQLPKIFSCLIFRFLQTWAVSSSHPVFNSPLAISHGWPSYTVLTVFPAWPIQAFKFCRWCIKMWAEKTASGLRVKVSSYLLLPLFLSPSLLFSRSLTSRLTPLSQGWI